MNLLTNLILIAMLAITTSAVVDQKGGFIKLCAYQGANLTGQFLGMYCRNDHTEIFGYNYTWIDLDYCVGNNGGQLVGWENGTFSGTCTNCTVAAANETLDLTCSCWGTNNKHVVSSLDLMLLVTLTSGTRLGRVSPIFGTEESRWQSRRCFNLVRRREMRLRCTEDAFQGDRQPDG
ncbi:hypothetical protein QBC44DRAFT_304425 [Cladorrhinum sp. PSN332]|nr:hypothetical protein QBC44DRAFT_304425 [Cladorrhinum sp. PSN332]